MRRIAIAALALLTIPAAAWAQGSHYTRGYVRQDGTYVQPHMQTNPDSSRYNNWSTQGNVNPYTGQAGTQSPYPSYGSSYTPAPTYRAPSYGYTPPANAYGSSYGTAPKTCTAYGCY